MFQLIAPRGLLDRDRVVLGDRREGSWSDMELVGRRHQWRAPMGWDTWTWTAQAAAGHGLAEFSALQFPLPGRAMA